MTSRGALHQISALLGTTASLNVGPNPPSAPQLRSQGTKMWVSSGESHGYTFRLFGSVLDLTGSLQQGIWERKFPGGGLKGRFDENNTGLGAGKN